MPGKSTEGWETTGVVFVADDLGAWLVGLLADAGRKKLTTALLGSDQERALRQAATAAVQLTARELHPVGGDQAVQLAMVISEIFGVPVPGGPLAGHATLLEELQAGIAQQLAALDDPGLTGTGQSSAELLGVPGTVLAEQLAGHLVREIMLRGSRGGPLAPLAGQMNHEVTQGMLARLPGEVRDSLAQVGGASVVASQPVRLLPRPGFLAGREDLLGDLDTRLTGVEADGPRVVALCGLGGAGKTSLALEYAYRRLAGLGVVWQFPAEEPTALAAGFSELADLLGARSMLNAGDPVAQVHAVLAARPGDWLLLFDNAPGLAALQGVLPPKGHGQVLITSQDPHWPGRQAVDVPVLGQEVAAGFLQARTGSDDQDAALELADELGGLPLALEQAAPTCRRPAAASPGTWPCSGSGAPTCSPAANQPGTTNTSPPPGQWPSTSSSTPFPRRSGCCGCWRAAHPSRSRSICCSSPGLNSPSRSACRWRGCCFRCWRIRWRLTARSPRCAGTR